jgi:hypothetical protein
MRRLEGEIPDSAWHLWLLDSIGAADLALVDLTGHNPFVMYEQGNINNRQIPTGFIVNAADRRVPATVRGAAFIPYGTGAPDLGRVLVDELRSLSDALQPSLGLSPPSTLSPIASSPLAPETRRGCDAGPD